MKQWLLLLFVFALGCNPKVVSYLNPKAKFRNYETFRLVSTQLDSEISTDESTRIFDLIKENILEEMDSRDYKRSNITPDLTLRYEMTSSTRVETNANPGFGGFFPPMQLNSRTIYEAILLLELYNENKKLVWQGSYDLKQQRKEKKASKAIEKAVGQIFTSYPYRALSSKKDESLETLRKPND